MFRAVAVLCVLADSSASKKKLSQLCARLQACNQLTLAYATCWGTPSCFVNCSHLHRATPVALRVRYLVSVMVRCHGDILTYALFATADTAFVLASFHILLRYYNDMPVAE